MIQKLRQYLPALFFLAGFAWDALTIGRQVQQSDLIILSSYLLAAGLILWWLAHHAEKTPTQLNAHFATGKTLRIVPKKWREQTPYFLLQFLFGSLLSALFILYFKSASYAYALVWSTLLAATLIGNEFLEHHYKQQTIAWTMFGFCAILLLNFILPCILGSIHWFWFVLSTLVGAGFTHFFYKKANHIKRQTQAMQNDMSQDDIALSQQDQPASASIVPTWIVASLLMLAYFNDVIPPVPLVELEAKIGTALVKNAVDYRVSVDDVAWWQPWRLLSNELHIVAGERVYYVTAIFAPQGLKTRLYHKWQHKNGTIWVTQSRIGFALNGGRQAGFRGYTFKQNLSAGDWRIVVETEEAHTVSVYGFTVVLKPVTEVIARKQVKI